MCGIHTDLPWKSSCRIPWGNKVKGLLAAPRLLFPTADCQGLFACSSNTGIIREVLLHFFFSGFSANVTVSSPFSTHSAEKTPSEHIRPLRDVPDCTYTKAHGLYIVSASPWEEGGRKLLLQSIFTSYRIHTDLKDPLTHHSIMYLLTVCLGFELSLTITVSEVIAHFLPAGSYTTLRLA